MDLIDRIDEMLEHQKNIVEAFMKAYPNVQDWEYMIDAPKTGNVNVDDLIWSFEKHGAGFLFRSPDERIVDIHRYFASYKIFDAWKLFQFIESTENQLPENFDHDFIEIELKRLCKSGKIRSIEDFPDHYSLPNCSDNVY